MPISRETIEYIKKNVPIKDVVSKFVDLKNNKGVCPFHNESDPSFHIYPETNTWYCFGCGRGGDLIKFVELIEGIDFKDAVTKLAENGNIELEYDSNNQYLKDNFIEVIDMLDELEHEEVFNENILNKYNMKHRYLLELGFKEETIDYFEIGYCDDENDILFNRITIPWRNSQGELVGVVGRDVTNNSDTKYIAKRGSKKKKHLYNLNNAKINFDNGLIVVEDEKSVWRLWEFGFNNAVALGNCDLGNRKWLLGRHCNTVYLCLDNDESGKKAIKKIIPDLYPFFRIYVVKLPSEYKDIADISDIEEWNKCWENKIKVIK